MSRARTEDGRDKVFLLIGDALYRSPSLSILRRRGNRIPRYLRSKTGRRTAPVLRGRVRVLRALLHIRLAVSRNDILCCPMFIPLN